MSNIFKKVESGSINIFHLISKTALIILGFIIVVYLFKELYSLFQYAISFSDNSSFYEVLKSILAFFLFFEFLALITMTIKNNGHVSLIFLFTLAITALVRSLLTYHENVVDTLVISASILILLACCIALKKYMPEEESVHI